MVNRRIGREDSQTRAVLLKAALKLMRAEGYAAVTSRRLAAFANLKPQLVHYYFRTMDELFEELFRQGAERYLSVLREIGDQEDSLVRLWELCCNREVAVQTIEFLALANRQASIKELMTHYSQEYNTIQSGIIRRAMAKAGVDARKWPPETVALIMENLPRILAIGDEVGVKPSYEEAKDFMSRLLNEIFERSDGQGESKSAKGLA